MYTDGRQMALEGPAEIVDVAKRELGETPKLKQDALNELRRLISGEPSLDCPLEDDFLIKFLRGRKYDVHSAFKNVKKYFRIRMEYRDIFEGLTPSSIPFDAVCRRNRLVTISRQRDPEGRVAAMLNIGAWNEDICPLIDLMKTTSLHIERLLFEEDAQIRGVVFVVNVQGLGVYHLTHYTPSVVKRLITITQIRLFGHDLREVRDLVPDDLISEVHGGTHENYDYDTMERELQDHAGYFEAINGRGYHNAQPAPS